MGMSDVSLKTDEDEHSIRMHLSYPWVPIRYIYHYSCVSWSSEHGKLLSNSQWIPVIFPGSFCLPLSVSLSPFSLLGITVSALGDHSYYDPRPPELKKVEWEYYKQLDSVSFSNYLKKHCNTVEQRHLIGAFILNEFTSISLAEPL